MTHFSIFISLGWVKRAGRSKNCPPPLAMPWLFHNLPAYTSSFHRHYRCFLSLITLPSFAFHVHHLTEWPFFKTKIKIVEHQSSAVASIYGKPSQAVMSIRVHGILVPLTLRELLKSGRATASCLPFFLLCSVIDFIQCNLLSLLDIHAPQSVWLDVNYIEGRLTLQSVR